MKLKDFDQFINEGKESKIEAAHNLFENDLLKQEFIQKIFGKESFDWMEDYELDSDSQMGPDGLETIAWIEIHGAPKNIIENISNNYEELSKPFEEWAKRHDLYDPEITTPDPNEKSSLVFQVNLY